MDRPTQYLVCSAVPAAVFVAGFVVAHYRQPRYALALMVAGIVGTAYAIYQLHGFDLAADPQAAIDLAFIAIVAAAITGGVATCGLVVTALFPKSPRR